MALSSKKNNRKCIVCSKEYQYCNHCQDGEIKPAWYAIFHDQNCHDVYDAVANIYPVKGKDAAKKALAKCDLKNKKNFHPNIIKTINEIYDIKDEIKEKAKKVESVNDVVKDETNVKVEQKSVAEAVVEQKEVKETTTASAKKILPKNRIKK